LTGGTTDCRRRSSGGSWSPSSVRAGFAWWWNRRRQDLTAGREPQRGNPACKPCNRARVALMTWAGKWPQRTGRAACGQTVWPICGPDSWPDRMAHRWPRLVPSSSVAVLDLGCTYDWFVTATGVEFRGTIAVRHEVIGPPANVTALALTSWSDSFIVHGIQALPTPPPSGRLPPMNRLEATTDTGSVHHSGGGGGHGYPRFLWHPTFTPTLGSNVGALNLSGTTANGLSPRVCNFLTGRRLGTTPLPRRRQLRQDEPRGHHINLASRYRTAWSQSARTWASSPAFAVPSHRCTAGPPCS
jgi:hypothetical protein